MTPEYEGKGARFNCNGSVFAVKREAGLPGVTAAVGDAMMHW
jgi:hypothetical protein